MENKGKYTAGSIAIECSVSVATILYHMKKTNVEVHKVSLGSKRTMTLLDEASRQTIINSIKKSSRYRVKGD